MQEIKRHIHRELTELYSENEIRSISEQVFESVCGMKRQDFLLCKDKHLSETERNRVLEMVDKLKKNCPLQYLLGEAEFFGRKFRINQHTLIPRPETEELIELVLAHTPKDKEISIWDIGTGSGCIAVTLAFHLPKAKVYASDYSLEAIETARKNAAINKVSVHFFNHDIFSSDYPFEMPVWDVIVSNPPYITPEEKEGMSANVLLYEPHEALFVPQGQPLLFYERIADLGLEKLKAEGGLFFETSSLYGKQTAEMLREKGFGKVDLFQDLSRNDRMIYCRR
jgi:protein-(glutamine-N5) methyltransferase, release factor-specific